MTFKASRLKASPPLRGGATIKRKHNKLASLVKPPCPGGVWATPLPGRAGTVWEGCGRPGGGW